MSALPIELEGSPFTFVLGASAETMERHVASHSCPDTGGLEVTCSCGRSVVFRCETCAQPLIVMCRAVSGPPCDHAAWLLTASPWSEQA